VHPFPGTEERSLPFGKHPHPHAGRVAQGLVLAACVVLLAACQREPAASGDSPQVAAAKAAVTRKLNTPESAEFRDIVEYTEGIVCGEFNVKKMFSGTDIGFRKFIYNAPEPGALAIDNGDLSRQDIGYWCSEEPDKRMRMLVASVTELGQACQAAGNNSSDASCRLAATQKLALDALRGPAAAAAGGASAAQAGTAASGPAAVMAASAPGAAVVASRAPAVTASSAAAAPAASSSQPAVGGNPNAAIPAEVELALRTWRERWQDGDVDGYLRMYEASFTGGARSHAEWEQQRRKKMKNVRPSIGIERLQPVRTTPQEVELRFVQVYSAKQHRDTGNKTMVFRRSPQGWLIADERWAAGS
jgi:hypothetical protein